MGPTVKGLKEVRRKSVRTSRTCYPAPPLLSRKGVVKHYERLRGCALGCGDNHTDGMRYASRQTHP